MATAMATTSFAYIFCDILGWLCTLRTVYIRACAIWKRVRLLLEDSVDVSTITWFCHALQSSSLHTMQHAICHIMLETQLQSCDKLALFQNLLS